MGDGCIQRNNSKLGVKDKDFAENFRNMALEINIRAKVVRRLEKGRFKYFVVQLNSRWLYPLLQNAMAGDFVNVPFVNGFFDAEGSALFYKYGRKTINRFMIYNIDRVLLEKIQKFFLAHEIESKIYSRSIDKISKMDAVNHIVHRNKPFLYCLKVRNDKTSMLNFCKLFSFSIRRKEEARKKIQIYYKTRIEPVRVCDLCSVYTEHYAHGLCEKCYRIRNRKKNIAYLRNYYRKNKRVLLERQKVYYRKNAGRIAVRGKIYYQNHKEQYAKSYRAYYLKNRVKINKYQRERMRRLRASMKK